MTKTELIQLLCKPAEWYISLISWVIFKSPWLIVYGVGPEDEIDKLRNAVINWRKNNDKNT